MKLVLASRNPKKIRELETLLTNAASIEIQVLSLDDIGFTEDIVEDGSTFEENALIKASVPARLGYIGIADDSGLMVDALEGAPGIYSARYAGEHGGDTENNAKLLAEMLNVSDAERGAAFVSAVALVLPKGMELAIPAALRTTTREGLDALVIQAECRGTILHAPAGEGGFGYDPLFFCEEFGRSFAQLTAAEKNSISHRGKAMRAFTAAVEQILK